MFNEMLVKLVLSQHTGNVDHIFRHDKKKTKSLVKFYSYKLES